MKSANRILIAILYLLATYSCQGQEKCRLEVGLDPYMHYSDEKDWLVSRPVGFTPSFSFTYRFNKFNLKAGRYFTDFRKLYDYDTISVQNLLYKRFYILYQVSIGKEIKIKPFNVSIDGGLIFKKGTETKIKYEDIPGVRLITYVENRNQEFGFRANVGLGLEIIKSVEFNIYSSYTYFSKSKLKLEILEAMIGFSF